MRHLLRPYIIDVEASGFDPDSYPIEIGLAMEPGERFCSLIKPEDRWQHWSAEAEECHKITRASLLEYGKPAQVVASMLNLLLKNKTVYTDGWVVDKPWVQRLYNDAGMDMEFRVSPLEMILNEAQMEIWHQTKAIVEGEIAEVRHRASSDALVIQTTFVRTREILAGQ